MQPAAFPPPPPAQADDAVAFRTRAHGAPALPVQPAPAAPAAIRPTAANNALLKHFLVVVDMAGLVHGMAANASTRTSYVSSTICGLPIQTT